MSRWPKLTDSEFFWARVQKGNDNECWQWLGAKYSTGYGEMRGKRYAHRFSLEMHIGKPLGKLQSLHHCDNPSCVNPTHLYAGTDADNRRDARERLRFKNGGKSGSILTADQVREIRKIAASRLKFESREKIARDLSRHYPVTHFAIRDIIGGTRWSHIKEGQ